MMLSWQLPPWLGTALALGLGTCVVVTRRLAGYDGFEFVRVGTELDAAGEPIEGSGFLAPTVRAERCVGCGLCQTRCHRINVISKCLLTSSAVVVEAGSHKEDRLRKGSYVDLRNEEQKARQASQRELRKDGSAGGYLPDFLQGPTQ